MEHLGGGASPESFGDNNTTSNPSGSQGQPASGSSDNSQSRTRHAGGPTFDSTWGAEIACRLEYGDTVRHPAAVRAARALNRLGQGEAERGTSHGAYTLERMHGFGGGEFRDAASTKKSGAA